MSQPAARRAYRILRANLLQRLIRESRVDPDRWIKSGVEVVGLFSTATGLGESARLCAASLIGDGIPVTCRDMTGIFGKPATFCWHPDKAAAPQRPGLRIFHLNPPMLPPAILSLGPNAFARTYNIGYWAWELPLLPEEWQRALRYMNAVFVPSSFTRTAVARYTSKPVSVVPHPVPWTPIHDNIRPDLGVPTDAFLTTTVFNFSSSMLRKNPQASITAFQRALGQRPDAFMVVKSSGGDTYPEDKRKLQANIHGNPRIKLIDETWESRKVQALIADSSALLSLHRSEGFGLTIAEAIRHKTPVIATAWSGNMDFCDRRDTFLVAADLTRVGSAGGPELRGLPDATWAEPDIDQAASHLQTIYRDRPGTQRRAEAAAIRLAKYLSSNTYRSALQALLPL